MERAERKHVVVIGGSAAGMAAALLLAGRGHRVTLLEKEALPPCDSPLEAFERWERRGAPQTRHSHAFLARLHNLVRERAPQLYADLLAAGAEPMRFTDIARETLEAPVFEPSDDEIVLLACRRITFDWVVHRHLARHTDVDYRDGVAVEALLAEGHAETGLPRVTGVRLRDARGERGELGADLVIDASGRGSHLNRWLDAIGAEPLEQESERCGIFYCSRFYRLREGVAPPPMEGPIGGDLGYMKFAIFQGDSRIFSITLAASPDDAALRRLREPGRFQAAALALPSTRKWVAPDVSEPITDVYTFADLKNTRRHFVVDGRPRALGIQPIGDALMHSNPLAGRGCTFAWVGADLLAEAFDAHPDDPLAFASALDQRLEAELVPWYRNMRDQDRASQEIASLEREGVDPCDFQRADGTVDPRAYMRSMLRDGLVPALALDVVVLRAFMRVFNMLDDPRDLLKTPDLFARVVQVWQGREQRAPTRSGPGRAELVEQLESTAA